jgi:NAD(P)-dependent dehydrogenase (short-subunit alcohol dehydrogenase family)
MTTTRELSIVITGGARGIGRELFRHFLRSGHRILVLDTNEHKLAYISEKLPEWSSGGNGRAVIMKWDPRNRDSIRKIVKSTEAIFDGRLDVLINNAMTMPRFWTNGKAMDDLSEAIMEEWDTKIAIGLSAPFLFSRLCVPLLKAGGTELPPGCIVNISSTRTCKFGHNHEAHSATQGGLLGLTQSLSVSLGYAHKIRVNAILLGWIHVVTDNRSDYEKRLGLDNELKGKDMNWHPAGRVGMVQDVFKAVEYLMGAEFVTGQEIVLDGGLESKMVYP